MAGNSTYQEIKTFERSVNPHRIYAFFYTITNFTIRIMRIIIKIMRGDDMPLTPKEFVKLLEKNDFVYVLSNNGSHRKYYNKKTKRKIIVPFHVKEFKKGLEQKLLKQAGLKDVPRR